MASVTRTIDAFRLGFSGYYESGWDAWRNVTSDNRTTDVCDFLENSHRNYGISVFQISAGGIGTVSSLSFKINIARTDADSAGGIIAYLFTSDPTGNSVLYFDTSSAISNASVSVSAKFSGEKTVTFNNLSISNSTALYVALLPNPSENHFVCDVTATSISPVATATVSYPVLTMSLTPDTVGVGSPVTISFTNRAGQQIALTFKKSSTTLYTTTATSDSIQVTPTQSWFETAGGTGTSMTVSVSASDQLGRTASGSFNLTQPELTIAITPATVGTGQPATISISNRSGQQIALTFKKGSTTLYTMTATSDYATVTPTNAWFTTAGETGTSMTVSVSASDAAFGRTASSSFSLKQALTVTTVAPKNTTRTATSSTPYTWSLSGNTTQASAVLFINNYAREYITGAETTAYTSHRPPAGTVSWYVRVTNNLGIMTQSDTATFTIQYVSTSYLSPSNSKTSGSINRFASNRFDVQMLANGTPYTDYTCENAVFYWRPSWSSSWYNIAMTRSGANGATVTIPANTFPKGTIQWYAEAGDGQGNTRTTSTYNLSTVAVPITAIPVSPIDTIEERNTPTDFVWRNSSALPSTQASAELQYSQDQSTWTSLGTVTGTATTFTAEANAIPSGQISWRVRVKNIDDVYGSWSNPVTFVNYGAPVVTNVQADTKPYTTITWSASTQQSYLLVVDGKAYGPYIGENTRSFTMFEPLADGNHVVVVKAQNDQGLWNDPEETAFSVLNVPGESLVLSSESFVDTALSWNRGDNTGDFYVYRDNEIIGNTHKNSFLDRRSIGTHDFFVIEKLDTGYYTKSNVITTTTDTNEINMISLLSGGEWVSMVHALKSQPDLTYKDTQAVAYSHMSGRRYPSASVSEFRDRAVSGSVVFLFTEEDAHCRFKSLLGMPVILKTKDSDLITGILDSWERTVKNQYYTAYSFTVTVVDVEDFIDDT